MYRLNIGKVPTLGCQTCKLPMSFSMHSGTKVGAGSTSSGPGIFTCRTVERVRVCGMMDCYSFKCVAEGPQSISWLVCA